MIDTLATNCVMTRGYNRTLLADLLLFEWWAIPHYIADLLEKREFSKLKKKHGDFYTLLKDKNIIVSIPKEDLPLFPTFDLKYVSPSLIEHALIDWDENYSKYDLIHSLKELESVGCRNLSLRFYTDFDVMIIEKLFDRIFKSTIEATDITIPFDTLVKHFDFFESLKKSNGRFKELIAHSCPNTLPVHFEKIDWIIATKEKISDCTSCGKISPLYFCLNMPHYTLTKNYNNCLYKKLGIDIHGNIKNCPSSKQSFGLINEQDLMDTVLSDEFQKLGLINKDQIEICSDCEFRSICSDCRIYTENEGDIYSKPIKCSYNPYISKWEGENGHKTLVECGVIADENGLTLDHEKIAKINAELWSEE